MNQIKTIIQLFFVILMLTMLWNCSKLTPQGENIVKNGNCATCHDLPMASGAHSIHVDKYNCDQCHSRNNENSVSQSLHINDVIDISFEQVNSNILIEDTNIIFENASCSNILCHGSSKVDLLGITWNKTTVSWNDKLECSSCHDYTNHKTQAREDHNLDCDGCHKLPFHTKIGQESSKKCGLCHGLPPQSGLHNIHNNYNCSQCHNGYSITNTDTTISESNHINGINNVDGTMAGGTFDSSSNSCSNVWCHGNFSGGTNATINWNDETISCGACHATPTTKGAHAAHTSSNRYTNNYGCSVCHSNYTDSTTASATHINLTKDVDGLTTGTFTSSTSTCNNVYCHGEFTNGSKADPNWTTTSVSCTSCHGQAPNSGMHHKHVDDINMECQWCHTSGYLQDSTVDKTHHINGVIDIDLNQGVWDGNRCSSIGCHGRESW